MKRSKLSKMHYFIIVLVCVSIPLLFWLFRKPKVVDKSFATYTGRIEDYAGNKKLVVAFTASWAGMWIVTREELRKIDREIFDLRIVDDATERPVMREHDIRFLPTVALVENGKITKRIQNLSSIDQLNDWK